MRVTHITSMTLSDYLKQPDVTATGVARQIGVSHSTVLRWADGSIQPPMDRLRKLNEVTAGQVTPNDFLTTPPLPTPAPQPMEAA